MSLYLLSPDDTDSCCDCQPDVCDACTSCPSTPTVEAVISGISTCCTAALSRISGLGAINGVHTLTEVVPGQYSLTLSSATTQSYYAAADCTSLLGSDPSEDVEILFNCAPGAATLDVRLASTGEHLLLDSTPPASAGPNVFAGEPACTALVPYTFGGTATVTPIEP